MPLGLRYLGHRCTPGSAIVPWYIGGELDLEPGQTFAVPRAGLVLGRGASADVRVASNGVARAHARVRPSEQGSALVVDDLGSTNGTTSSRGPAGLEWMVPGDILTLAGVFDFEVVVLP